MSDYTFKSDEDISLMERQKDVYIGTVRRDDGTVVRPAFYSKKMPMKYDYNKYVRKNSMVPAEYDLYQILQAENVDGYVKRAIKIKSANMFKSGWRLTGKNPETVKYVKKRLLELGLAGGYPFTLLVRDLGRDFIRYSNAFLVKVRNANNSSGKKRVVKTKRGDMTLLPVSAYFILPPETVHIETDNDGHIVRYHQILPNGNRKSWPAYNVVHLFYDRKAGYNMGAPVYWPVIDDVRAMRRIEENLEYLVYYYIFPFFVVYVGTDNHPPAVSPNGQSEIDIVTEKINRAPVESGLVLSYRHKIDVIGFDNIIPIEKYLEHFKSRVFAGLGVSSVDMGEGSTANRNTADSMTRQMIDDVKDYQQVFAELVNFEIIVELLLESPWGYRALDEDNMVSFSFNEIDIDNRIKVENHNGLMYQMNMITEDEARLEINREPISDKDRKKLYINTVQKELINMGNASEAAVNSAAATKQQPTNQHGKNAGPTKAKSALSGKYRVIKVLDKIFNDFIQDKGDLTFADIKKNVLDIDYIKRNALIKDNVNTALKLCESMYRDVDRQTLSSIAMALIEKELSTGEHR